VRQLTDTTALRRSSPPITTRSRRHAATTAAPTAITWRRVLGGSRFAIAISTKEQLLLPEERLLAILRWIAEKTPHSKRWYPVLLRYIAEIAGRVKHFGGDPSTILPSPTGKVPGWPPKAHPQPAPHHRDGVEVHGKIDGIVYDHFGDFAGFVIETETGQHHNFHSRQEPVLHVVKAALNDRARVTVISEHHELHAVRRIVVR
jgi:hypothetical protein